MVKTSGFSTFRIAAAYIGTVVGAGFASGQEVLQFFGYFGMRGVLGVSLAGLLFILFGYLILDIGYNEKAISYRAVIQRSGGRLAGVIDAATTFFLFGGLTAMTAGSGAIFAEQYGLPYWLGSSFMMVASLATVLSGLHGVITAISLFVPFLLGSVLLLSSVTLLTRGIRPEALAGLSPLSAPVASWPASAVLYASYNLLTTSAVLGPVGAAITDARQNLRGAMLGGAGLALGALAIHLAVLSNLPEAAWYEVPMLLVASRFGRAYSLFYSVVLLGEIYTTAVANLYGFTARIIKPDRQAFTAAAVVISLLALLASRLGFTTLVRTVYPLAGWAGLGFMIGLLLYALRKISGRLR